MTARFGSQTPSPNFFLHDSGAVGGCTFRRIQSTGDEDGEGVDRSARDAKGVKD